MKKWLIIGGLLIIVVAVALVVGISNIGPIIKTAVNTYGPELTKTDVRLGDVSISLLSGRAKLEDFHLGNPKGFKSPQAMDVGSIYVDLDAKSVTRDPVIINRVEVIRPEITYEKTGDTDNFKTIVENVKSTVTKNKSSKGQAGKKGAGKKLIIKDFIVKNGKVTLAMSGLRGSRITASLPEVHLKDLGEKSGGASSAEIFNEIFGVLYAQITSPSVTKALRRSAETLGKSAESMGDSVKKVGRTTQKGLEDTADKMKKLFGQ
jgi:uncharacterized protein involved in outer membrane biogenesis